MLLFLRAVITSTEGTQSSCFQVTCGLTVVLFLTCLYELEVKVDDLIIEPLPWLQSIHI